MVASRLGAATVVHACSVITRGYLPQARALAADVVEHHPEGTLTVLVLDDDPRETVRDGESFAVVRPVDLGLDRRELHRMAAIYDPLELSCAFKPMVLAHVLDGGAPSAVWIDSDVGVYANIEDVAALAETAGVVLTPEVLEPRPEPRWGGHFNAGLLAVGPSGRAFLDWWSGRLRRHCVHRVEEAIYADQWWLDVVPAVYDHHVLRDPGLNVAPWNIDQRPVAWTGTGYEVNGKPLRAFHFGGFDPGHPERLAKYPPLDLRKHPGLERLVRDRAERLIGLGYYEHRRLGYGYAESAGGVELTHPMRRLYRSALLASEQNGRAEPPDPFDEAESADFEAWVAASPTGDELAAAERAAFLLERGPDSSSPTRFGAPGRLARRALIRLLRPYAEHEREVDRALLAAIREADRRQMTDYEDLIGR